MSFTEDMNFESICLYETGKKAVSGHIISWELRYPIVPNSLLMIPYVKGDGAKFTMKSLMC